SATVTRKSMARARARTTEMVCGWSSEARTTVVPFFTARRTSRTASATAVASARREAWAMPRPGGCWTACRKVRSGRSRHREGAGGLGPTLGGRGVVGGVGGVPGGVRDEVAADDGRGDRVKVALADELGAHDVLAGQVAQIGEDVVFGAAGREVELLVLDRGGDGRGREGGQRIVAEFGEH